MPKVQYLEIDLYNGSVMSNITVDVDISKPIVNQVLTEVVKLYDEEDQEDIFSSMLKDFKSTSTGYKIKSDEFLYLIIFEKSE